MLFHHFAFSLFYLWLKLNSKAEVSSRETVRYSLSLQIKMNSSNDIINKSCIWGDVTVSLSSILESGENCS